MWSEDRTPKDLLLVSWLLAGFLAGPAVAIADEVSEQSIPQIKVPLLSRRTTPATTIRVKVFPHERNYKPHYADKRQTEITLRSDDECQVYEGRSGRPAKTSNVLSVSKLIPVTAEKFAHPLWVECKSGATLIREKGLPHFTYPGALYVHKLSTDEGPYLEVINIVALGDYLKGVVPSEVYVDWPMESLKTQAVAARTYAVFHYAFSRRYNRSRLWDVDDTIRYQAYTGLSMRSRRTDEAVQRTQGQILTHGGDVIQAYYHADSGGQTESAWHVWETEIPYVAPRPEFFREEREPDTWQRVIHLQHLTRRLRTDRWLSADETVVGLSVPVIGRTESGRVKLVTLQLADDGYKNIPLKAFRKVIGRLPSTLFSFVEDPERPGRVKLTGQGNGHGVGMSQLGAAFLASSKGWDYKRILDFYYLDTTLCDLRAKAKMPDCYNLAKGSESKRVIVDQSRQAS
jgi:stage II sporulation protein D